MPSMACDVPEDVTFANPGRVSYPPVGDTHMFASETASLSATAVQGRAALSPPSIGGIENSNPPWCLAPYRISNHP
jgi:hypothetical protein